jgi:hypothetical protein
MNVSAIATEDYGDPVWMLYRESPALLARVNQLDRVGDGSCPGTCSG